LEYRFTKTGTSIRMLLPASKLMGPSRGRGPIF